MLKKLFVLEPTTAQVIRITAVCVVKKHIEPTLRSRCFHTHTNIHMHIVKKLKSVCGAARRREPRELAKE